MKKLLLILVFAISLATNAMSQTVKEANPADVASLDAIMKAVYDVISGDAGKPRDWERFRTLFHKDARMIPSGKNPQTGVASARAMAAEDYIKRVEPVFAKEGFHEREVARRVETYGN